MHEKAVRLELARISQKTYHRGLVRGTGGNVSVRLQNGNILATRSGINKGMVEREDLVEVSFEGRQMRGAGKPSTELGMHIHIYLRRPDVHAVVHAHPVHATGFATARIPLVDCLFPEVIVGMGSIPLADYATPSTDEVAKSLEPFIHHADAVLLANHGVVTYGPDLLDAYYKMEKVEHAAHITFVARMLGGEIPLSDNDIAKLRKASVESYGKDFSEKAACSPLPRSAELSDDDLRNRIRQLLAERGIV